MYCNSYAGEQKKVVREPKFCSNTGSFLTQNFCSKTELFKFRDVRKPRFDSTVINGRIRNIMISKTLKKTVS